MNGFDRVILEFLNRPALHSAALDFLAMKIATNLLVKGGVALAVIWWLWFSKPIGARAATDMELSAASARVRRLILIGFAGTFVALALARGANVMFPSRARPINHSDIFRLPVSTDTSSNSFFINDSSFPSDHAALFYALATTIYLVSRRAGVLMLIYVTLAIVLPRMYLLLHYPTDIIAGGIIGSVCVVIASLIGGATRTGRALVERLLGWSVQHAPSFYAVMFLWSFSIAELFDSLRKLAHIGPVLRAIAMRS